MRLTFWHIHLILWLGSCAYATAQPYQAVFISPSGDDRASGASPSEAIATIAEGFDRAQAGDTLYLLPGIHKGRVHIQGKHGAPNRPIVLTSVSPLPASFAIIDGQSAPSTEVNHEGLILEDCSWIDIERIVFQNCWTNVIELYDANYISVRACHFSTGKRVIHAIGEGTHHVLVEDCYIKHPHEVWKGWSWESLHHGELSYYNGALLHPNKSGGGHVLRNCRIINLYNAFRTRPRNLQQDGNTEIYGNTLINVRDNEFEPERFAWNMHYYHNDHVNIHKMYSIDGVEGGNIYIYGNTYTQTEDPWAMEEVSGIFKYKAYPSGEGPLTYPCYAFNNSYYTDAKVLKEGEASNHHLRHYNNAYEFIAGDERFRVSDWQKGYEFDHDCINQPWPEVILNRGQEAHGMANTDPGFADGAAGRFELTAESPCRDAGTVHHFPELEWTQSYEGHAPDIGAYEGDQRVQGPPFRFIPSPEGAVYDERPRITRHRVDGRVLYVYFSTAIDPASFELAAFHLYEYGHPVRVLQASFPRTPYELVIQTDDQLSEAALSLAFDAMPRGQNGQPCTYWASTLPIGREVVPKPDLTQVPDPFPQPADIPAYAHARLKVKNRTAAQGVKAVLKFREVPQMRYINHLSIYRANGKRGDEITSSYEPTQKGKRVIFESTELPLEPGKYIAKVRVGRRIISQPFELR